MLNWFHMKIVFFYIGYENLGVEYLSSVLKREGHNTKLIFEPMLFDESTGPSIIWLRKLFFNTQEKILKEFKEYNPDIACFSVVSDDFQWALDIARKIKQIKDIPIIFGGSHPTSVPKLVLKEDAIDFVIRGEGEDALVELVKCIEKKKPFNKINNLCYKNKNKKIIINPIRELTQNLDEIPFPDKELFYNESKSFNEGYLIAAARGCPFSCSYCYNSFLKEFYSGKKYQRKRSVNNIIKELKISQRRYHFKYIRFNEELFGYDKKWLKEFSQVYPKTIGLPFYCNVHPAMINKETVRLLKESKCEGVFMGVQTTDYEINSKYLNRITPEKMIQKAIQLLQRNGIKCTIDLMFGLPNLNDKKIKRMLWILHKSNPDFIRIFWLRFYPKTKIIKILNKEGLLSKKEVQRINRSQGLKSFWKGGTTYQKDHLKYVNFLFLYPLFNQKLREIIIKKELYNFLGLFPHPLIRFLFLKIINKKKKIKFIYHLRIMKKYREFIRKKLINFD